MISELIVFNNLMKSQLNIIRLHEEKFSTPSPALRRQNQTKYSTGTSLHRGAYPNSPGLSAHKKVSKAEGGGSGFVFQVLSGQKHRL